METTLMTIDISVTDIEDNNIEEESDGQLMVDMECPNCKVVHTFSEYIFND